MQFATTAVASTNITFHRVPSIKVPMLLHFAEKDGCIPDAAVESVKGAFAGRDNVRVDVYMAVSITASTAGASDVQIRRRRRLHVAARCRFSRA